MPPSCSLPRPKDDGQLLCPPPMGQNGLPIEAHKLITVVVFLLLAGFSNWITLAIIHDFAGRSPLPDIVFRLVPQQSWALRLGDLMVTLSVVFMVVLMLLHKHRAVVIRRVLFVIGVLYAMRTISLMVTQLPSGYNDNVFRCVDQLNGSQITFSVYFQRFLVQFLHVGFQDFENKMLCGDLLFSGHTLILAISALTVQYYAPTRLKALQYIPKCFMVVGIACMIISRTHYTVDCLFAYWLSVGVFSMYHSFCEIDTYRERKNSILSSILLMKAVGWLEANVVPGKLENTLEIPFYSQLLRLRGRNREMNISGSSSTVVIEPV
ncbi:PAP2-C domain-containing protein [Aphelenchoides fujianensis]|nr:PAP2-C domain-containing protein [Aphelenchoides fujianensis]